MSSHSLCFFNPRVVQNIRSTYPFARILAEQLLYQVGGLCAQLVMTTYAVKVQGTVHDLLGVHFLIFVKEGHDAGEELDEADTQ